MSSLVLKIIAIIAMALDHVGFFLYDPEIPYSYELHLIFRIIGRIAMPIFCFMIAEGFRKTRDPYRYAARLAIAALISEIPYNLCFFNGTPVALGSLNVMFSLLLGLLGLILYKFILDKTKLWFVAILALIPICLAAHYLGTDYGFYAPLFIFLFYIARSDTQNSKAFTIIVALIFGFREVIEYGLLRFVSVLTSLVPSITRYEPKALTDWNYVQVFAAAAALLLLFYNGKPGYRPKNKLARQMLKYSFYLFYPIHLIIIWIIFQLTLTR